MQLEDACSWRVHAAGGWRKQLIRGWNAYNSFSSVSCTPLSMLGCAARTNPELACVCMRSSGGGVGSCWVALAQVGLAARRRGLVRLG